MWVGGIPPLAAAFAMVFVLPSDKNVIAYGEEDSSANTGQNTPAKKALGVKCSANLIGSLPSPVCF